MSRARMEILRGDEVVAHTKPIFAGLYFWRRTDRWGLVFGEAKAEEECMREWGRHRKLAAHVIGS